MVRKLVSVLVTTLCIFFMISCDEPNTEPSTSVGERDIDLGVDEPSDADRDTIPNDD